ncbi:D-alanyl-D-alanine carboxypeptidase family protein [Ruicaihuangia caeni]|uniref:D-alanyl-D-alanine carboxypeptidase n=1 Tax=Ruicaihuangia caeni TaxID=3042517 RepID=A0AAW6T8R2_9MICO|nr:D-alanyl-D-alanine carboxypeptidase [Klugiella sp. YN-L-19]MDI2098163.1 D-alanyl-D-alanine carboxypeptidase [Klugiella sp. YN-L-19]
MPLTRRQIYFRRRLAVFGTLAVLLGVGAYVPATLMAPLPEAAATLAPYSVESGPAAQVALPEWGASAIGAEGFGDRAAVAPEGAGVPTDADPVGLLASAGSAEALPIASIAKVVTALVVLDAHPLEAGEPGPVIATTAADLDHYHKQLAWNGSVRPVAPGLAFTQHELLELLLVVSANNYAETLVTWAFGSEAAYVDAAGAWLSANGLTGITIVDCTGLDPANRASAAHLLPLAELAMQHPVIAEIVGIAQGGMHDIGPYENTNPVLGDPGVIGVKTGTLMDFGHNLLFAADIPVGEHSVRVHGVVLGAPGRQALSDAVRNALASAGSGFQELSLTQAGQAFGTYSTAWDERTRLTAAADASIVAWSNTPVSVLVSSTPLSSAEAGARVGVATFVVGGETVEVPLVLDEALSEPDPWWRLTNPAELF